MDDTVSGPIRLEAFEMYPTDNTPEKIVQEKSHRLFITLREPTNTGKNWKPLFQSTFEVYSRLWKFQQVHRKVLENEQYYGLKRWELGELASKIGQLYYYYYLRTSDTSYLQESFTFYSAIQKRKYFEKVLEAKSSALIIKKLRYHIRYIVVCLLLNKFQLVHQLSLEFQDYIKKYEFFLEEKDAIEWRLLYNEISSFISAQQLYDVYYEGQLLPITSHLRYSYKTPLNPQIKLEQIVVVGNYEHHAKFSGLTLDMYGLLQSLEFDPEFSDSQMPELQSQSGSLETSEPTNINRNPEKHLLFRPTIDLLTLKLATCQKDMTSDQSALLLYLSGEGSQSKQPSGISMASLPSGKSNHDTINTFFPHDLISFTRKPMFVIVDSDNSMAFKNFRAAFDQPFLCILSPPEMPVTKAFCFVSNIKQLKPNQWQYAMDKLKEIELYIISLLQRNEIDFSFKAFVQDEFLAQYITRFIFCRIVLQAHLNCGPNNLPDSNPSVPDFFFNHNDLKALVNELVVICGVSDYYRFCSQLLLGHSRNTIFWPIFNLRIFMLFFVLSSVVTQTFFYYPGIEVPLTYDSDILYSTSVGWISSTRAYTFSNMFFHQCMDLCRENDFCRMFNWQQVIQRTGGGWKRGLEPRGWINIYEVIGECTMYEGGDPNDGFQVFAPLGMYAGMIFSKSNCEVSLSGIVFCDFQKRLQSSYDLVVPWNGTSIDNTTVLWNNDCFWDDSGSLHAFPVSSNLECQQRCVEEQACTHLQTESFNITKKHCILYSGQVQVSTTYPTFAAPSTTNINNRIGSCSILPQRNNCSVIGNQYQCDLNEEIPSDIVKYQYFEFKVNSTENIAYNYSCALDSGIFQVYTNLYTLEQCKSACTLFDDCKAFAIAQVTPYLYCWLGSGLNFKLSGASQVDNYCGVILDRVQVLNRQIQISPVPIAFSFNGLSFLPYGNKTEQSQDFLEFSAINGWSFSSPYTTFLASSLADCATPCKFNTSCSYSFWDGNNCMLYNTLNTLTNSGNYIVYLKLQNCQDCTEYKIRNEHLQYLGLPNQTYYSNAPKVFDGFLGYNFNSNGLGKVFGNLHDWSAPECEFTEPLITFDNVDLQSCYTAAVGSRLLFSYEYKGKLKSNFGVYPYISYNSDGICRFFALDRLSSIRYKATSACAFSELLGKSIPITNETQPHPVRDTYFFGKQLVSYVNGRFEIWAYLWTGKSSKYTTFKGPYIDCVNYCAKQKSCIQFVWFSPVSFVFEGDCYSYESSVAVGDMVPYKGAVSGWIEGRLPCTIKGMNVTCDKSILSQNQSSTVLFLSKTTTPIITTTPTINIDMLTAHSTIRQSDFPTTTPVADTTTNTAGNSNDFGINASSTFNDAGLPTGHTSTIQPIVVTLIVNDTLRDNIQYHSKFQITTPIIAGLLVSALLNIILFVFLAKATWVYPQAKNPDSADSSIPYSDKAVIPDRQFIFDTGSQNELLESNYYPVLPRKSSFTNVITSNHHIYLIATMENAQDCLKLLEKLFLEFVSNSDSDIPGCLKISRGDSIKILKMKENKVWGSNGKTTGKLPPSFLDSIDRPRLELTIIKESNSSKSSLEINEKIRIALDLFPNQVSIKYSSLEKVILEQFSLLLESISGNEKVFLFAGQYNDVLHAHLQALASDNWTFIDCANISNAEELHSINLSYPLQ
ncbi:hypothetical protein HK103_007153 [Boothiomyces macroporosus]|uniref:Uncharacterized protein n=1 Tax=Boothiomyces macroporosus TaxID=261099 RepID=A0AAD5UCH0_9FUNG|nr:hypothetical protein HK103_007153 [Boothiomyces macroporosus]